MDPRPDCHQVGCDQHPPQALTYKQLTILRIVFQAFIMDIQQSLLHGGEFWLSPFYLTLRLPEGDEAWFCPSLETWLRRARPAELEMPDFLSALKLFWNSQTITKAPRTLPRAVKLLMYGILALAHDMKHRNDNSFSSRTAYTSEALGSRVSRSFQTWLQWWDQTCHQPHLETIYLWRNCACAFRLGHTLYEVNASDWRILVGVDSIDGRRVASAEYGRAKRNIRNWARSERAGLGLRSEWSFIFEISHLVSWVIIDG